jgi:hypothetical protein
LLSFAGVCLFGLLEICLILSVVLHEGFIV